VLQTSAVDHDIVSFTLRPHYIYGKFPGTHWEGGWVEFRAGLDMMAKRKMAVKGLRL
jgi:hypothetical protein